MRVRGVETSGLGTTPRQRAPIGVAPGPATNWAEALVMVRKSGDVGLVER